MVSESSRGAGRLASRIPGLRPGRATRLRDSLANAGLLDALAIKLARRRDARTGGRIDAAHDIAEPRLAPGDDAFPDLGSERLALVSRAAATAGDDLGARRPDDFEVDGARAGEKGASRDG